MNKRILIAVAFGLFFVGKTMAQQQPFQTWLTYNHQARLTDKWGYTFDANHRTRGAFPFTSSLTALRASAIYTKNSRVRFLAGYAWFATHVDASTRFWLHENRLQQQWQHNTTRQGLQHVHRVRLEQRWRQEFPIRGSEVVEAAFTFRARYMFQLGGPIFRHPKTNDVALSWQAANEIMLHVGEGLNGSIFDQNRTLGGVVINMGNTLDLAVLYQFIALRQPLRQQVVPVHSIRLTLFHQLDFRKKAKAKTEDKVPITSD
jgi:hypothetical protein